MAGKMRRTVRQLRRQRRRRAGKRAVARRGGRGDAAALRGIKQGVGKSVAQAFGATSSTRFHPCHHDAFHHFHLPLPRATGPYTVVRTTQYQEFGENLMFVGPFFDKAFANGMWTDISCLEVVDETKPLSTTGNIRVHPFTMIRGNGSWTGAQVVPSAFSVQVMNPEALQTSKGIVYIGRVRTAQRLSDVRGTTGKAVANQLISYNNPRLCAAAKLAFRGVQVDCVPFNMSELANFTSVSSPSFSALAAGTADPLGFAPVFIYNPNKIDLQLLICCEWRVRFDPSNPAQATHNLHHPAPESVWAQAQHYAEAIGNGVVDIADRVANTGNALFNAAGAGYRAVRGMQALRGATQLALA